VKNFDEQLAALSMYLATRRDAILNEWRKAVLADRELTTAAALPRRQFMDHIPIVLQSYERRLLADCAQERIDSENYARESAHDHGLERWQQGYKLREVTQEWGHLHFVLLAELEAYTSATPSFETGAVIAAWRVLAQLHNEGVTESTAQYFQLQEIEAAGEAKDLEQIIRQMQDLERERGELWRQAAHDLRGNFSAVTNASFGLGFKQLPEEKRETFVKLLQKSVVSLQGMLNDVMNLARLQAGQEKRKLDTIDAGEILHDLVETLGLMASERGLELSCEGPLPFEVEGDAIKVCRIAQNLLINALKYTGKGRVRLVWGNSANNDPKRWALAVEDTGPGFQTASAAPLADRLKTATAEAKSNETGLSEIVPLPAAPAGNDSPSLHQEPGEGIGLSIVKRLCDLLDATLEVESTLGVGSTFRVVLPRSYQE